MKKLLIVLLALAIATPAMAVSLTTSVNNPAKQVTIGYTGNGSTAATRVRAFALKVSVSAGTITGVTVATGNQSGNGYGIFPGTISINADGTVANYNSPVEPNDLRGVGGKSLIGTNQVVLAMGSLYAAVGGTPPGASGDLVTVTCSSNCTMTITGSTSASEVAVRGGCIAEDGTTVLNVGGPYTAVIGVTECLKNTALGYADWVAWGKPNCWCYGRQCRGDINGIKSGLFWVQSLDLTIFRAAFNKNDATLAGVSGGICADLNRTKSGLFRVQSLDLTIFRAYFNKGESLVPICPAADYNFYTTP